MICASFLTKFILSDLSWQIPDTYSQNIHQILLYSKKNMSHVNQLSGLQEIKIPIILQAWSVRLCIHASCLRLVNDLDFEQRLNVGCNKHFDFEGIPVIFSPCAFSKVHKKSLLMLWKIFCRYYTSASIFFLIVIHCLRNIMHTILNEFPGHFLSSLRRYSFIPL